MKVIYSFMLEYEKKDSLDKFKNKVIEFKQVLVNR